MTARTPALLRAATLSVVLSIALLAGCGGGDDESGGGVNSGSGSSSNSSSSDGDSNLASMTAQQVNDACSQSNAEAATEIAAVYKNEGSKVQSEREGIQLEVRSLVPILIDDAAVREEAIAAFEGSEGEVDEILAAFQGWEKKARGTPLKIVIANDVFNEARQLATESGLTQCGLNPFEASSLETASE